MKYVRLYGFNHRRTQAQFDVAWTELEEAVPKRKGCVLLGVAEDNLLLDGVPVEVGQAERGFTQLLNAAGITSIQFSRDVTIEEFEKLVRAFSLGGSKAQDFASEIKRLFPDHELVEVPLDHPIYHLIYDFPKGVPKIHQHDGKPAQGFGIFLDGRLVVYYDYQCDLGDGWEDYEVHRDPPEKHEAALRMGVNLFAYAVSSAR